MLFNGFVNTYVLSTDEKVCVWGFMRSLLLFGLSGNIFVRFVVNSEQQNKHVLEWDWTNCSRKKKIKK